MRSSLGLLHHAKDMAVQEHQGAGESNACPPERDTHPHPSSNVACASLPIHLPVVMHFLRRAGCTSLPAWWM